MTKRRLSVRWVVLIVGAIACAPTTAEEVDMRMACKTHPVQQETTERCVRSCIEARDTEEMGTQTSCLRVCQEVYCWKWPEYKRGGDWYECRKGLSDIYHTACINAGWNPDK